MTKIIPHVALLIDTNRSFGRDLLKGIRAYVLEHGPWSIYLDIRSLDSKPPPWLKSWKGDGILVRTGDQAVSDAIEKSNLPVVELRHYTRGIPFVGVDNAAVGRMVTEHLLHRGFRKFAVYGIGTQEAYEERQENFVQAVHEAGFECEIFRHPLKREQHTDWERTQESICEWLKSLEKPVGVLACTDLLGFWLLDACKRADILVPEEVAVVGCENDEALSTMSSPPMSSVQFQAESIGFKACELLEQLMKGNSIQSPVSFPPLRVVTRQSSDIIAAEDEAVAAALLYIRLNAAKGIRVEDVLKEIPLSRSALDHRMKAAIGRTAKAEILRVQLERVKQLLTETDLALYQIAAQTGFQYPQYMAELFKKKIGITPGTYRAENQFR